MQRVMKECPDLLTDGSKALHVNLVKVQHVNEIYDKDMADNQGNRCARYSRSPERNAFDLLFG